MSNTQTIRDTIAVQVEYEDRARFGTLISGRAVAWLARHLAPLARCARAGGMQALIDRGPELLTELLDPRPGSELHRGGAYREELLFPPAGEAIPAALRIERPGAAPERVAIPRAVAGDLAAWLGEWQIGGAAPSAGPARSLHESLASLGVFGPAARSSTLPGAATFVGHASVQVQTERTRVLVDPRLPPRGPGRSASPAIGQGRLRPHAVLITHSHRDHFHLETLLRLGRDTLIVVPSVWRESVLAIDMARRLAELGFRRVRTLGWFETLTVGDLRVVALPFYGEQPTADRRLHPDIRNTGNTYLVEAGGRRFAFVADAGRDQLGDVRDLAREARARFGPVDVLFGGHRTAPLYPVQYAMTSVPHDVLFVPPPLRGARQETVNDAHALIDTAERWGARHVVPYASGDSDPRAVLEAASHRSTHEGRAIASSVRALVLEPGDSLDFDAGGAARLLPGPRSRAANAGDSGREPPALTLDRILPMFPRGQPGRRRPSVKARAHGSS